MNPRSQQVGPSAAYGTVAEGRAMIGHTTAPVRSEIPAELGVMQAFLGITEDPNPVYWDAGLSERLWGHRIVPAGMLLALYNGIRWAPDHVERDPGLAALKVPLPTTTLINVKVEHTFHRPLRLGEWLSRVESVVSISEEKTTSVGTGYFVTTHMEYTDEEGHLVAEGTNVLLRYRADKEEAAR